MARVGLRVVVVVVNTRHLKCAEPTDTDLQKCTRLIEEIYTLCAGTACKCVQVSPRSARVASLAGNGNRVASLPARSCSTTTSASECGGGRPPCGGRIYSFFFHHAAINTK